MRDIVGAGALSLVEQTVAAGRLAAGCAQVVAVGAGRRANEQGVELTALAISPEQVAGIQALVDAGGSTTSSPAASSTESRR
jgi:aspartyl-tRNA(Asn)/glutamyl-tRNA(Gln) amidotransferase subunit B